MARWLPGCIRLRLAKGRVLRKQYASTDVMFNLIPFLLRAPSHVRESLFAYYTRRQATFIRALDRMAKLR